MESGVLGFAFVVPLVDGGGAAVRGGFVVVRLRDDFLKVGAADLSGEHDGGIVLFSVTKEGDVGEIGEDVEAEEILNVGEFVGFAFADFFENGLTGGGFAESGQVAVKIPLGLGGDGLRLKRGRECQGSGKKREEENSFHRKGYAVRGGKVTFIWSAFLTWPTASVIQAWGKTEWRPMW
jgi:hypothetical protein